MKKGDKVEGTPLFSWCVLRPTQGSADDDDMDVDDGATEIITGKASVRLVHFRDFILQLTIPLACRSS